MSGTKEGGKKAAATNLKKQIRQYGADFYKINGAKGGRNGHTGGFAANRELASIAGAKGGRISSRSENKEPLDVRRKREESERKSFLDYVFGRKNGKD